MAVKCCCLIWRKWHAAISGQQSAKNQSPQSYADNADQERLGREFRECTRIRRWLVYSSWIRGFFFGNIGFAG
jgi:hypothetical protein